MVSVRALWQTCTLPVGTWPLPETSCAAGSASRKAPKMTNTRKRFIIRRPFLERIRRAAATGFAAAATAVRSISAGLGGRKRRARISCRRLLPFVAACPLVCFPGSAAGQEANPEALRVFLDCAVCDFDYLRTEMTYVNYVRDRKDAEVHVLVTTEPTGGGGTAHTRHFCGLPQVPGRGRVCRPPAVRRRHGAAALRRRPDGYGGGGAPSLCPPASTGAGALRG